MRRSVSRFAHFTKILSVAEPDVMVQLVRLAVLYEDLKLEVGGIRAPHDAGLDELSEHYREMYFVRRAFSTIWEMSQAFHKLNSLRQFRDRTRGLDAARLGAWTTAIQFFERHKTYISNQRNAYGGHFHDKAAHFVLDRVDATDRSVGVLETKFSDDHSARYVLKFAEVIVSNAFFLDQNGRDPTDFMGESVGTLLDAVRHSTAATQVLSDVYFLPAFTGE